MRIVQKALGVEGRERIECKRAEDTTSHPAKAGKKHTGGDITRYSRIYYLWRWQHHPRGSGEYGGKESSRDDKAKVKEEDPKEVVAAGEKSKGLLTIIFGDDEEDVEFPTSSGSGSKSKP